MTRILKPTLFALPFLLVCNCFWSFSGDGVGTKASPYVITDVTQLQQMNLDVAAHYILGNDVAASRSSEMNEGAGFIPIGEEDDPFTGSIDGRGFRIFDLVISRPTSESVGLFGFITDATIQNVHLDRGLITGRHRVGGVAGWANVSFISNCSWKGSLRGDFSAGGVVGHSEGSRVEKCHAAGVVSGSTAIGGLMGNNSSEGLIIASFSESDVIATGDHIGGLLGSNDQSQVVNSYATGSVIGRKNVGGLIGETHRPVLGLITWISRCYAIGLVNGEESLGGLVGHNMNTQVSFSYWDIESTGQNESSGGEGKTTAELFEETTFEAWNFDTVWCIEEGESYPDFSCRLTYPPTLINSRSDINGDNKVDCDDLMILLEEWGRGIPPDTLKRNPN